MVYKVRVRHGFTLLELIIVIIIVGVLASVALVRFFALIESSRSVEALTNIQVLRQSMERCYLMGGSSYSKCSLNTANPNTLDLEDPGKSPNAHFTYLAVDAGTQPVGVPDIDFTIVATRNTLDAGDGGASRVYYFGNVVGENSYCGSGKFKSIASSGTNICTILGY